MITDPQTAPPEHRRYRLIPLRVVLTIVVWYGIPGAYFGLSYQLYPILGNSLLDDVELLVLLALLVSLTVLIYAAGLRPKAARISGIAAVILALVLIANQVSAIDLSPDPYYPNVVDPAVYDAETAQQLALENLKNGSPEFTPFKSDAIARLEEPSTLHFTADRPLPKLDCATALLPLMSSFVTAVYPEEATTVSWAMEDADWLRMERATVQYNNSSSGFMALAERRTDIFFGTIADLRQAEQARERGVEFEYTPICREGFVFFVNASNPVGSLTLDQVKDIYAGRITNWSEVGGEDAPIIAYQRNENSGSQSRMSQFMEGDTLLDVPTELHVGTMGGLVESVADYDNGSNAIGYSFRYYVTDLVGDYDVKLLAIDGVEPTLETITDGSYPLTGEFYAVTRQGDANEDVWRLIDWIRGPQGQELVRSSGYAGLS